MQEIINSLLTYAEKLNLGVIYTAALTKKTPSFADTQSKFIVINSNWYRPSQLPFIIAHEISHLLQCSSGDAKLSATTLLNERYEKEANHQAIHLLVPFYVIDKEKEQVNVYEFMKLFDLPTYLEDICHTELNQYIN
ncbi:MULTISPECIES: ImmA/IrrE family metallo-endopeptidase [Fructobacillus]|uniref:M78 family (ImmA) n=1 Tax=Fructobacillus tropaeoli TaxID=709323 RepID=A0ABM9N215_9LACO|nr:M78 family (ImmA) [Fructobacillus sp. LMG 32999]CAK1254462.1 M78 family (ImmA) [Fructobacillus tropaeoli]